MRTRLMIATLLVTLVAGACGDDDLGGLTPDPNGGNDSYDPFGDDSGNPFGDGDFTGFTNEECLQIVLAWSQAASFGFGGSGDLEDAGEMMEDLAASVPPEVAADFAVYAQAMAAYGRALADAGIDFNDPTTYSSAEAQAALTAASAAFDSEELEQASENIGDFLDAQCSQGG